MVGAGREVEVSNQRNPGKPRSVAIIRLLVGWVFLLEGILKFLWPDELGAGRFTSIGIPSAHWMAPFVGVVEVVCGLLVIAGFLTRLAVLPLLIDISVAIISTKIPIWLGHGYWRFSLPKLKHYGLLSMLHEARTDFSMLLGLIFLLVVGAGDWAMDTRLPASPRARRNDPSRDFESELPGSGPESFG
jgi:putative oxidoreductase